MKDKAKTYNQTWDRRNNNLQFDSYKEFLESDYWKSVKKKARKRKNYDSCKYCDCTKVELHHRNYDHIHTKHELGPIIAVCRNHHQLIHDLSKSKNWSVNKTSRIIHNWHKRNGFLPQKLTEILSIGLYKTL